MERINEELMKRVFEIDPVFFAAGAEWSRWFRLEEVAAVFCTTSAALRGRVNRYKIRTGCTDEIVELSESGMRFRKNGSGWLVSFASSWRGDPGGAPATSAQQTQVSLSYVSARTN
jgi:hypothetical protein